MITYIAQRLLWIGFTLICVSLLTFLLIFASPGDPAALLVPHRPGEFADDPALIAQTRAKYGLDQPIYVQYARYMGNLLQGDFGYSYHFQRPVLQVLLDRFPSTALLAGTITLVSVLIGIPMGILMALRNKSLLDRGFAVMGMVIISLPSFLLALLLIYLFAFTLKIFPSGGSGSLAHLVLPTLSVALPTGIFYAIVLRSSMLDALGTDYVRTAASKGLEQRTIALRHMLPNAVLPVVTMASLNLAGLLTGIVLVEQVFNWPGIGLQALKATQLKDVPVVMGSVFFGALLIGLGNLLADLLAAWLDPRVRLES